MKKRPPKRQSRQDAVLAAVRAWQSDGAVQPLTCVNDSSHALLEGVREGTSVALVCATCGYRQVLVPPVILRAGRTAKRSRKSISMAAGLAAVTRLMDARRSVDSE